MINKENLIKILDELISVEEIAYMTNANISQEFLKEVKGIDKDRKKEIQGMIDKLYNDSETHKATLEAIKERVQNDKERYEY